MGWQSEEDEDDEALGYALMRREELRNMAMRLILSYVNRKDQPADPVIKGWDMAIKIQKNLDKETPIPEPEKDNNG